MPRKTRPPRIRKDKKGYYLIQNRVKRYIDDPKKLKEAVEKGELAYKTSKKSPLWQETFKPTEPVNMDPLERRKIEKARWDIYNAAVERYKKDIADYQKRQVELTKANEVKSETKTRLDIAKKDKVKFDYTKVKKYEIVNEELEKLLEIAKRINDEAKQDEKKQDEKKQDEKDPNDLGYGLSNEEAEELAQRMEQENQRLEAIEAELNAEYEKNMNTLREQTNLENKYIEEDANTTMIESVILEEPIKEKLKKAVSSINNNSKSILDELDKVKKSIGIVKFYEYKVPDMVWNDKLKELQAEKIKLHEEYNKLIKDIKDPDRPTEIKTSNDEEKKIIDFLLSMRAKDLLRYAYEIHHARFTNKNDAINAMLADPKTSKIIMLAYEEYKNPANKLDFFEISHRISKSVVGFGDADYDGLYGDEILKIMKPYKGFLGVIMNDEIPDIIESSLHWDRFGFVINKDNHNMEGSHWCAVFVDIPDGSVEYYDSFGDDPTDEVKRDLLELIKEHEINYLMKFKVNGVKVQDLRTGSCGWFSMKFLIDRFNGVPFDRASGFNITGVGVKKAEASIKKMKKGFGYI